MINAFRSASTIHHKKVLVLILVLKKVYTSLLKGVWRRSRQRGPLQGPNWKPDRPPPRIKLTGSACISPRNTLCQKSGEHAPPPVHPVVTPLPAGGVSLMYADINRACVRACVASYCDRLGYTLLIVGHAHG